MRAISSPLEVWLWSVLRCGPGPFRLSSPLIGGDDGTRLGRDRDEMGRDFAHQGKRRDETGTDRDGTRDETCRNRDVSGRDRSDQVKRRDETHAGFLGSVPTPTPPSVFVVSCNLFGAALEDPELPSA